MQREYKKYMITTGAILASSILMTILMYVFLLLPQKDIIKTVNGSLEDKKQELTDHLIEPLNDLGDNITSMLGKKYRNKVETQINDIMKTKYGFSPIS